MGSGMTELKAFKIGMEVIGAIDAVPSRIALDLALFAGLDEQAGAIISDDTEKILCNRCRSGPYDKSLNDQRRVPLFCRVSKTQ